MKQKSNITLLTFITLFALYGCTTKPESTPSKNEELNNLSPTGTNKKAGVTQNILDGWLKDDWTPSIEKNEEIQEKYMKKEVVKTENNTTEKTEYIENKNRPFTLQEYVDKARAYQKANPSDENASHVKQMESLPAIGK
ncbi:hypothetical protein [Sulfurimonas sp.]|uniref:hypothetical protein n=1 Tax=Sulfurimonas sp. TaxID=2022749 RepID=UPI003D0BC1C8